MSVPKPMSVPEILANLETIENKIYDLADPTKEDLERLTQAVRKLFVPIEVAENHRLESMKNPN